MSLDRPVRVAPHRPQLFAGALGGSRSLVVRPQHRRQTIFDFARKAPGFDEVIKPLSFCETSAANDYRLQPNPSANATKTPPPNRVYRQLTSGISPRNKPRRLFEREIVEFLIRRWLRCKSGSSSIESLYFVVAMA